MSLSGVGKLPTLGLSFLSCKLGIIIVRTLQGLEDSVSSNLGSSTEEVFSASWPWYYYCNGGCLSPPWEVLWSRPCWLPFSTAWQLLPASKTGRSGVATGSRVGPCFGGVNVTAPYRFGNPSFPPGPRVLHFLPQQQGQRLGTTVYFLPGFFTQCE